MFLFNRYADGPRYYSEPKLVGFTLTPFSHPDLDSGAAAGPAYPPSQLLALHLAALQHQLSQLYAAAAAAVALGRVLVLPQLQCFCYRDPDSSRQGPAPWLAAAAAGSSSSSSSGWSCRAPGDDASVMPFNCTLDQVWTQGVMRHFTHSCAMPGAACGVWSAQYAFAVEICQRLSLLPPAHASILPTHICRLSTVPLLLLLAR
jgi:hypothetical protein